MKNKAIAKTVILGHRVSQEAKDHLEQAASVEERSIASMLDIIIRSYQPAPPKSTDLKMKKDAAND